MNTFRFLRDNARWLAAGVPLMFLSSFGRTFFIAIFGIRRTAPMLPGAA